MSLGTVDARQSSEDRPPKPGIGRLLIPVVVVLVVAGLGWWGSQRLGRPELGVGLLIGLIPVFVLLLVRLARRLPRILLVTLGALVPVLIVLGTIVLALTNSSPNYSTGPPPGPLPLAVTVAYTGQATIDNGQISLSDSVVVSADAMTAISDNLLSRLKSTSDSAEIRRTLTWCVGSGGVPSSWTLPAGLQINSATPAQLQSVLVDNWSACFSPQRLTAGSWQLVERLDTGYVYQRLTAVAYNSGELYAVTDIPVDLGQLDTGLTLEGRDATYGMEAAAESTVRLAAPAQTIADIDPATTVNRVPGVGDRATVAVDRTTSDVHIVVLKPLLRNDSGLFAYSALKWGPLKWFIGVVTVLFSGILTDVGRSALKWLFVAVFRRRPKPSA
jgi:hypothetical protein